MSAAPLVSPPPDEEAPLPWLTAFLAGARTAVKSVLSYVIFGTFIGYGALCHDLGFSLVWGWVSTALVWAGPAQVIIVSTIGSGAAPIESAIAVSLSGMRLLPMVAALLPVVRSPLTRWYHLIMPAHFTAASMWVEGLRAAPGLPRASRITFCNGLGATMMLVALIGTLVGYEMASKLPPLFAAAVLFLTPMSFLVSVARNSRELLDKLALVFGLVLAPLAAYFEIDLALLVAGLAAGTLAYIADRIWKARR
jgi:predicted branched-subunit amino acid permease